MALNATAATSPVSFDHATPPSHAEPDSTVIALTSASETELLILANENPSVISEESTEQELSEIELRELYENEEIDRFLRLFATYVTEVKVPDDHSAGVQDMPSREPVDETDSNSSGDARPRPPAAGVRTLSEEIAIRFIIPNLPPTRHTAPPFTIGRLRLTTQRIYLSASATYLPFVAALGNLATWENDQRSLKYCILFWVLWWYNALLPALILRLLLELVRRRIFPYPSLAELREHREKVSRADEFGDEFSTRLSASSTFDMKEMWRLFKLIHHTKKQSKDRAQDKFTDKSPPDADSQLEDQIMQDDATILDGVDNTEEIRDLKRIALHTLSEIADLHERIRNMFIWRQPASSRAYGFGLFFLFLVVLLMPNKYLIKSTYFILGFIFWHITPILGAMSPDDRARLPPAFSDVPIDAEYAMELISRRVAAGQEIKPTKAKKRGSHAPKDEIAGNSRDLLQRNTHLCDYDPDRSSSRKKWGEFGKLLVHEGNRMLTANSATTHETGTSSHPNALVSTVLAIAQPEGNIDVYTYPGQCSSGPGLITLTRKTLFFSPLMSQNPKLTVKLPSIKGVKKMGVLKGLQIRWDHTYPEGDVKEQEEKFLWVSGRDDLFARLVGFDAKRWQKV